MARKRNYGTNSYTATASNLDPPRISPKRWERMSPYQRKRWKRRNRQWGREGISGRERTLV